MIIEVQVWEKQDFRNMDDFAKPVSIYLTDRNALETLIDLLLASGNLAFTIIQE